MYITFMGVKGLVSVSKFTKLILFVGLKKKVFRVHFVMREFVVMVKY